MATINSNFKRKENIETYQMAKGYGVYDRIEFSLRSFVGKLCCNLDISTLHNSQFRSQVVKIIIIRRRKIRISVMKSQKLNLDYFDSLICSSLEQPERDSCHKKCNCKTTTKEVLPTIREQTKDQKHR